MLKRFIPFIVAGVLGIAAVVLMQQYLNQQRQELQEEWKRLRANYKEPVQVIVALHDIPEGAAVTEQSLGLRDIPENFVQPYATSRAGDVVGFVARAPIAEGEQLLQNKLRRAEEAPLVSSLSRLTPEGKRAITLGIDTLQGVGGFVRPGDAVDILWTFKAPKPDGSGEGLVTVTLLQSVSILAVNDQMFGKATDAGQPSGNYTVTVALTPQETSMLLFARAQGNVELSLRPQADKDQQVAIAPMNEQTLIEAVFGPQASQGEPASAQRNVEVYKGLQRSVVSIDR